MSKKKCSVLDSSFSWLTGDNLAVELGRGNTSFLLSFSRWPADVNSRVNWTQIPHTNT